MSVLVEVATDVVGWESGDGFTTEVEVLPENAEFDWVTVRSDRSVAGEARQLMRIRVALSP